MDPVGEEQPNLSGSSIKGGNADLLKSSVKRLRLWKRRQGFYGSFARIVVSFCVGAVFLMTFSDAIWLLPLAIVLGGLADNIVGLYIANNWRREIPIVLENAQSSSELGSLLQVYPLVSAKEADAVLDAILRILEAPAADTPLDLSPSDKRRLYRYVSFSMANKSPAIVLAVLAHITATQDTSALARVRAYKKKWPIGKLGEAVNHCLEVLTVAEENRLLRPSQSPTLDPLLRPAANEPLIEQSVLVRVAAAPEDLLAVQVQGKGVDT